MKEKSNISHLFDEFGNLTRQAMQDYLQGKLSEEDNSIFEKHIADSEFEREALEGMKKIPPAAFDQGIRDIHTRMDGAIKKRRYPKGRRMYMTMYTVGMAASVLLFAGIIYVLSTMETVSEMDMAQADPPATEAVVDDEPAYAKASAGEKSDFGLDSDKMDQVTEQEKETELSANGKASAIKSKEVQKLVIVEDDIEIADEGVDILKPIEDNIVIATEPTEDPVIVMEYNAGGAVNEIQESAIEGEKAEYVVSGVAAGASSKGDRNEKGKSRKSKSQVEELQEIEEEEPSLEELKQQRDAFMLEDMVQEQVQIFMVVEEMPEFPGGDTALLDYLGKNLVYPRSAIDNKIEGKVIISFVVEKDGSVAGARVLRGIGYGCDEEALRVVEGMPAWLPGKQRGKPVRVQYNLPVKFAL